MTTFKVKKFKEEAIIPTKREEDAGYDFYGIFDKEIVILHPGDIKLIPLGIGTEFPNRYTLYITERSGSGSKGISTRAGVVDSGYRGEIRVPLNNTSNKTIIFSNLAKENIFKLNQEFNEDNVIIYPQTKAIAQGLLIELAPHLAVEEVVELSSSLRGDGSFGSTGK